MRDGEEMERGWDADEGEGGRQMKNTGEKQIENLRERREKVNEWGGSYSCLCQDVNDNEAGTVTVEQLLQQIYFKLLQHARVLFLWGS